MTTPEPDLHQAYQTQLEGAGVPITLAAKCAEVLATDDTSLPNLGRTEQDQHLIDSSMEWMKAKGFFDQ